VGRDIGWSYGYPNRFQVDIQRASVDLAVIALRHNASPYLNQFIVRAILRVYDLGVGVGVPPAEDQKAVGERCCCRVWVVPRRRSRMGSTSLRIVVL